MNLTRMGIWVRREVGVSARRMREAPLPEESRSNLRFK